MPNKANSAVTWFMYYSQPLGNTSFSVSINIKACLP